MAFPQSTPMANISDCSPIASETQGFVLAVKITVGTTCLLSVLGASLIILTYVAFRDLRTTGRQLLVNLSVADILVALTHFTGLYTNYDRFLSPCNGPNVYGNFTNLTDPWCATQGALTMFSVLASFLWTIAVAVYLFVVIVVNRALWAKRLRAVFYPVCWGVPGVIVVAFGAKQYFGFEENVDIAWCFLRRVNLDSNTRNLIPYVLGYDVWIFLVFIVLPILYIWIRIHIRVKLKKFRGQHLHHLQSKVKVHDLKLMFVPLVFILLRIWDAVLAVPLTFMSETRREDFRATPYNAAFVLLSGIGTSAQGLANAFLFIALTKVVRQRLTQSLLRVLGCKKVGRAPTKRPTSTTSHSLEDTTSYHTEIDTPRLIMGLDLAEEPLLAGKSDSSHNYGHSSMQRNINREE